MADFDQYTTSIDASGGSTGSHLDSKPEFSEDEKNLIARMYKLVGERWSLIAGRIPGRTEVEIEKYWTSTNSNNQ